jgi:DNA-binding CsgD family transcriptional regulator
MPLTFALLADDPRLTRTERQILRHVERHTPRGAPELWASCAAIARALDIGVRTVQAAFARFRAWGWIALRRDYRRLRTRRALALGWRVDLAPLFPEPERKICAQVSAESALRSALPPDPPIVVPDGEEKEERDGRATAGARPTAPPPVESVRSPEPSSEPEPARIAAETAARTLFGCDCARRVAELVDRRGIPAALVALAVDQAAAKAPAIRARGRAVTWGLVWTLAHDYHANGPPPVALPPRRVHGTPSPRVVPPADEVPVQPIDWSAIVADMEAEGRGEAAKVIHRSVSRAPAGGKPWQSTPRPTCRTLTAHPAWHYTVRSEHEDDGARTRNLRRDRPDVSQHGAQVTSGQTSPTLDTCPTPAPEPQNRPEPEIRPENPRDLVAALAAALACSARVPHSGGL